MTSTHTIPKQYRSLDSEMMLDKLKVSGWIRQNIKFDVIQVIICLIIEFARFVDIFDEQLVGEYIDLSVERGIAKNTGPKSHPTSLLNDKLWTFTKSILNNGIFFRFFKVTNTSNNNIGRLSIGIAYIKSDCKKYSKLYPSGLNYIKQSARIIIIMKHQIIFNMFC